MLAAIRHGARQPPGPALEQQGRVAMAHDGFLVFDSDMHVHEPHDLYLTYMNPKWGDRIPRAEPRTQYSFHFFRDANGQPIRGTRFPRSLRGDGLAALASRMESVAHKYE